MTERARHLSISIVIPNWNGLFLLKQSLDSVVRAVANYPGKCEIIVVDNGSQDRSVDVLCDYYPEVRVIALSENTGFGHACNRGVKEAKGDRILFLNNDIFVPENFVVKMAEAFLRYPGCFSVSPQTNYWRGRELTDDVFSSSIKFSFNEDGEVIQHWSVENLASLASGDELTVYGTGAALLVDKEKFLVLGGFDPIYGLAYWEDVALCFQAWHRGWKSHYTPSVKAWHKISATSEGATGDSKFKSRMMILNYIIFHLTNVTEHRLTFKFVSRLFRYLIDLRRSGEVGAARWIVGELFRKAPEILSRRVRTLRESKCDVNQITAMVGRPRGGWKSSPLLKMV